MVKVAYHTDPVCPWSWALEPVVRKLMVEFGDGLDWTFIMGGLGRSLAREPAARAALVKQWLEVSAETQAPLDPRIWFDSWLTSTYPACMAAKSAAEQAPDGGYRYLRRLREAILCERRKLDQPEALIEESRAAGLDVERFRIDLRSNAITEAFAGDLERTEALAQKVAGPATAASRGAGDAPLPTLVFRAGDGAERVLAGFQPLEAYRTAAVESGATPSAAAPLGVEDAIARFGRVTSREVEVLCELPGPRASAALFGLAEQWRLRPVRCLTGYLWERAEGH